MITETLSGKYFRFVSGRGLMQLKMFVVHAGFTLSSSPILRVDFVFNVTTGYTFLTGT
jgi:hypothetical protein